MVKLYLSSATPKMAKAKILQKISSVNIPAKSEVEQAISTPIKAVHRTSNLDQEVLTQEAKNSTGKIVHRTNRMNKTRSVKGAKAVTGTYRMKKVLPRKAKGTPKVAPQTLKNITTSPKKSKKVKKTKRKKPVEDVVMTSVGKEEAAPDKSAASKPKTTKEINKFGLFVGGLNIDSREGSVSQHFSQFGTVLKCIIPRDRNEKGLNKGFSFVYLDSQEAIDRALAAEHTVDSSTLVVTKKKLEYASGKRKSKDSSQPGGDAKRQLTTSEDVLFVTPIKKSTSNDTVMKHFSQFGEVAKVDLPMVYNSSENKGFAFITFKEASSLKKALADPVQEIESSKILLELRKFQRIVANKAAPRPFCPNELYVGGLNPYTGRYTLKEYFSKYGKVTSVTMPMNKGCPNRGFGFVSFESAASLRSALEEDHEIDEKKVDVRATESKSEDNGAASEKVNAALAAAEEEGEEEKMDCKDLLGERAVDEDDE